jgi:hypothetical protein
LFFCNFRQLKLCFFLYHLQVLNFWQVFYVKTWVPVFGIRPSGPVPVFGLRPSGPVPPVH